MPLSGRLCLFCLFTVAGWAVSIRRMKGKSQDKHKRLQREAGGGTSDTSKRKCASEGASTTIPLWDELRIWDRGLTSLPAPTPLPPPRLPPPPPPQPKSPSPTPSPPLSRPSWFPLCCVEHTLSWGTWFISQ